MWTWNDLTAAEQEIMHLLGRGFTNDEIARGVGRSKTSVANTLYRLYRRMGVRNRVQAARWVLEHHPPTLAAVMAA